MAKEGLEVKFQNASIDPESIHLNAKQLDVLTQQVFSIQNILNQYSNQNLSQLKQIAKNYLQKIQSLSNQYNSVLQHYNHCQDIIRKIQSGSEEKGLAKQYQKSRTALTQNYNFKTLLTEAFQESDLFTMAVQKALNKQTVIYYVHSSKTAKVTEIYEIKELKDILSIQQSPSHITTRIRATKKTLDTFGLLIPKTQYKVDSSKLDSIYQQIIRRYNKYRYKYKSLVLWEMGGRQKWHGMWLSQKGDLAQAYATFVLKDTNGIKLKGNVPPAIPETGIESFMKIVQQVDAAFGGLQGDIEWTENGKKFSAAIKSSGASPQALQTTIELAKELLQTKMDQTKFLHKFKNKWKRQGRNTIMKMTKEQAASLINSMGKDWD